jgi:thiamine pyrophosphate-dependent acetolactate synthase large subunit-like protein
MLNARRESNLDALEQGLHDTSIPMTPQRVMKEIRDVLPRDAICLLDGNVSMTAAQEILPSFLPASRFTPGTNGCMGVGIPFAIGAKLVHRDRPVVVICGDFAFGLNAMEMETAVRFQIPIIIIVINNQGPSGGLNQKKFYPTDHERVAMFLPHLHYEEIMLEFGGHAEFIDRPEQISSAFSRARESGLPACLNVQVDPYSPFVKPRG